MIIRDPRRLAGLEDELLPMLGAAGGTAYAGQSNGMAVSIGAGVATGLILWLIEQTILKRWAKR
jgi:hypothetical protein